MEASPPACFDLVQTSISAETGGTVCAPVLLGNLFQGQVVFNVHGAQEEFSPTTTKAGISVDSPGADEELIPVYTQTHKSNLLKKFKKIHEGSTNQENSPDLNEIYTELYITEGGSGEVNNEHEVRQIEMYRRQPTRETPLKCNNIFKPLPGQDKSIRTVLTRGVAGIGKTVSVQKFILDWAEGKANQDLSFIFPLPFRELNLIKRNKLSLRTLLRCFYPETEKITLLEGHAFKVLFIFDGLDECRHPLDFQNNESLFDAAESASIDVLLTNLIKGNLLPSALLWITSRPAAANQILLQYVDQVTEIRGFSDPQKEEYFRKRISDQSLAERIITHIKSSRSLYIMCHIPVFCWIAATVLEEMLSEAESGETPRTLTQMFIYFLNFQIKHSSQKYEGKSDIDPHRTRESILALGKLAFQQLEKGNLIFYEEDLKECGVDVRDRSAYSGMHTQIFRQDFELDRVFTFVHLSIQEFLAALYAFLCFILSNKNVLRNKDAVGQVLFRKSHMATFLKDVVKKALQSENGHLDLFLRFLLGLSLESTQTLLRGLLPQTAASSHSTNKTIKYIKKKISENLSPEKSINLFHCLNELNDHSLVQDVQSYLKKGDDSCLSGARLSPAQWSALVFVLLSSDRELGEFDLSDYHSSEDCLLKLLPVVKASTKAVLCDCNLTEKSCAALASALSSNSSLRELNLGSNKLQDQGAKLLSAGLTSPHCKLEVLRLECCSITDEGCAVLVQALKSNSLHLKELNLNNNHLGESGLKELSDLLKDPLCKLETLQLCNCCIREPGCADLANAIKLHRSSHLRELNLSWNKMGDSGVKVLSDLLEDPHCKLEELQLECCGITEEGCAALVKALISKPSNLRKLNLNYNQPGESGRKGLSDLLKDPNCKLQTLQLCEASLLQELNLSFRKLGDSGVQLLCDLLEDPLCKLEKLNLCKCNLTESSCAHLASALNSNPSCLRALTLSLNTLQDSGVRMLSAALVNPHSKLEKLRLWDCNLTEKSCAALASALSTHSSSLRELFLCENKLGDKGVKLLSSGLKHPHCKLELLDLFSCNLTGKSCAVLASVLSSQFSSLRNLLLYDNDLGDSGAKLLYSALENPHCKLERLSLLTCCLTEESCLALASALSSQFSSLRILNLSANYLGDSGVKLLSAGLENPHCKLEELWLAYCFVRKEGCAALVLALKLNPSYLRELNLSRNKITDSGIKPLSVLLEDPHCKLEKLLLYNCYMTEKSCAVLASALSSNSSSLKELDLSKNDLRDSGVKLLSPGLENQHCKLEKLRLQRCNLLEESCAALASALSSSSSSLKILDLSKNDLRDSGVKLLSTGLENPHCKLEKLELQRCHLKEESCAALASALSSESSSLTELDLSNNELQDSGVKKLSTGLENPHCKLEKLELNCCSITREGCAALAKALKSNPSSRLTELSLIYNKAGDLGVRELSDLLGDVQYKLQKLITDCDLI
ncbi:NACHT, LRR and PYD domains-containing protein 3-like [Salminus brasiliensis]|uniref:NACHT, LRR and PYD domains-containing protein 3-like n=1 Tax=Salminus brasiliensis TaxID=930266 RepID=UPI003B831B6A